MTKKVKELPPRKDAPPVCSCGAVAELVGGERIYPGFRKTASRNFWLCPYCGAYTGCHMRGSYEVVRKDGEVFQQMRDGTEPLGTLADAETRKLRQEVHAAFDPIWKQKNYRTGRTKAYAILAAKMGIPMDECHVGMFDAAKCELALSVMPSVVQQCM